MRGTVAKRIRRMVYGDFSTRNPGYRFEAYDKLMALFVRKQRKNKPGTIASIGLRREYREAKKVYRKSLTT